jgi:hypothetical protein
MGLANEAGEEAAKEYVTCEILCPDQIIAMTTPIINYKLKSKHIYLIFLYLAQLCNTC